MSAPSHLALHAGLAQAGLRRIFPLVLAASTFPLACVQDLAVGAQGVGQPDPQTPKDQPTPQDPKSNEQGPSEPSEQEPSEEQDPIACKAPERESCDDQSCDCIARGLGIGCLGTSAPPNVRLQSTYDQAQHVVRDIKLPAAFGPREGERVVLMGTGPLAHFSATSHKLGHLGACSSRRPTTTEFLRQGTCPSVDAPEVVANHRLPEPLQFAGVDPNGIIDCAQDPDLSGRGDCSNSLQRLIAGKRCWKTTTDSGCEASSVHDASAFTISLKVPRGITSLSFDFAFLSAEYPFNYQHPDKFATDAFIVWLESSSWTGNVVTDQKGAPMTIDNELVRLKDAENLAQDCPAPCNEHRLHDFSMRGHAATPWLTTEIPVRSESEIELTFAILELGGPFLDSYALIDNMHWGCTPKLKAPRTRIAH